MKVVFVVLILALSFVFAPFTENFSAGWGRFEDKRKFEEVAVSFIEGYKLRRSYVDMVPFSV